jgi:hypothetical protein
MSSPVHAKYLLKITLDGLSPSVWRRFVVPSEISLDRLHDVIQIVMGWKDCHVHEFIIGKFKYTENPESPDEGKMERMFRLNKSIKKNNIDFAYIYDFGDDWRHHVEVDDINFNDNKPDQLYCLEGQRMCPPEDVGGVHGYIEFCESMSNKRHPKYKENQNWYSSFTWYPKKFDSEHYDLELINLELLKYLRWSRWRELSFNTQVDFW